MLSRRRIGIEWNTSAPGLCWRY